MFDVEINEFSSKTDKLLFNIVTLLKEHNKLLRQGLTMPDSKCQENMEPPSKLNIETMERKELIELIKTLPKGSIKGKYMTMTLDELRKQVKEVIECQL